MKSIIIYYSHTGNNALLAEETAKTLGIESFRLTEKEKRTTKTIVKDMIFHRKSNFVSYPQNIDEYDMVIFMGPIWMFNIPSPLKTYFKIVKKKIKKYAYISISGGALGPNPGIPKQLVKRLGKGLALSLDLNIANFCKKKQDVTAKDTSEYKLEEHPDDLEKLTEISSTAIKNLIN